MGILEQIGNTVVSVGAKMLEYLSGTSLHFRTLLGNVTCVFLEFSSAMSRVGTTAARRGHQSEDQPELIAFGKTGRFALFEAGPTHIDPDRCRPLAAKLNLKQVVIHATINCTSGG